MSRTLASSSGSVENLNVSVRCGWMSHLRQIRATLAKEIPSSRPSSRADQCVTPRCSGGTPPSASVLTTTSISSIRAGRPDRGRSTSAFTPPMNGQEGLLSLARRDSETDWTRDLRHYLETVGWKEQAPGPSGALWLHSRGEEPRVLALPKRVEPGTREWQGVLERLAAHERRPVEDVYLSIATQFVDVTRLRASNDGLIEGSIPLEAGVSLVGSAYTMFRAAATTAFSPRGHIAGNFSRRGEEITAQARMAHTEDGSYVLPVWMPLTPPEADEQSPSVEGAVSIPLLAEMDYQRASEPPERRVTRTLAQAISAVDEVIVRPEREPAAPELQRVVVAGASRELIGALHKVLADPAVAAVETRFTWAAGLHAPGGVEQKVTLPAGAAPRLKRAAQALRTSRRLPAEIVTGPIVEIRHLPGDPLGEVSIEGVRRGRRCEVRVRLRREQLNETYEWARTERAVLAEGPIQSAPGRPLWIVDLRQFMPLDETYLPSEEVDA